MASPKHNAEKAAHMLRTAQGRTSPGMSEIPNPLSDQFNPSDIPFGAGFGGEPGEPDGPQDPAAAIRAQGKRVDPAPDLSTFNHGQEAHRVAQRRQANLKEGKGFHDPDRTSYLRDMKLRDAEQAAPYIAEHEQQLAEEKGFLVNGRHVKADTPETNKRYQGRHLDTSRPISAKAKPEDAEEHPYPRLAKGLGLLAGAIELMPQVDRRPRLSQINRVV